MKDERKMKVLSELRSSIIEQIELFNNALKDGDFSAMAKAETELKEAESQYADIKATEVFDEVGDDENPIKSAIVKYWYPVLSHKNIREDGKLIRFELVEDKMRQIDLVKLAKYCNINADWQYAIEKFNQLLCLRAAHELKLSKKDIDQICQSFYMNKLSRAVELGETPDSNTQICKQLQKIIDAMVFEDDGKGKNKYKVNNHDVAYLLMCYTKKDNKKALTISTAKHGVMHRLVMDIAHRVILGKVYGLDYKTSKATEEDRHTTGGEVTTTQMTKEDKAALAKTLKKTKSSAEKVSKKAAEKVTEVEKSAGKKSA